ncbi:MAG: DUF1549 domain-containing protein [Planctomycetales bacterium]|nr:DUF1549 domain-containing protein [Planctomycetales bacterium]
MTFRRTILIVSLLTNLPEVVAADETPAAKRPTDPAASIAPRRPVVPESRDPAITNPIDRLLQPYFDSQNFQPPAVVADRVFARRVFLDVIGVLPTPEELEKFLGDQRPDKRERLVDTVLADRQRYAEHWLSFWNDALRNDYRGTGYIDGGRKQITNWLFTALADNKPYDQFTRELISPTPESEGFVKGIIWRGVVNASQVPPMQAAQHVSQVFLGINLKCASCHDSFVNDWKLTDAYGLAGIFADGKLEVHRCDTPTGEFAPLKFLWPELGAIDANAPRAERLSQLATILTKRENGRFTRTIVNRLWARLLGRGLIEPTDEMDNSPWNRDVLNWLAEDFADHGFDLKQALRNILASRAYQLPSVGAAENAKAAFVFRGPVVKRMTSEQFVDAVGSLTGGWPTPAAVQLAVSATRGDNAPPTEIAAKWIWSDPAAARATSGGRIFLRKSFDIDKLPLQAPCVITCDNQFTLFVNGKQVASSTEWSKPLGLDLKRHLVRGRNVIAVEAINWPDPETKSGLQTRGDNAAGLICLLQLRANVDGTLRVSEPRTRSVRSTEIVSDSTWLWRRGHIAGWEKPKFDTSAWKPAAELGAASLAPWNLTPSLRAALDTHGGGATGVRASLTFADALQTALGRSNREQVVTDRPKAATTLQTLELTNGNTLATQLTRGAQHWLVANPSSPRDLIQQLYATALGRAPSSNELATATELLGEPLITEGVEDLLWVLAMLPEFQLVY